jgi:hypothetical protein
MNRDYYEDQINSVTDELERLREENTRLRMDTADALRMAADYKAAFERLEQEMRELQEAKAVAELYVDLMEGRTV